MQQKKVITLLRVFSKKEIIAFNSFILSPFFNTNQRIIELWTYLRPCWPEFDSEKLSAKKVHKHLFPSKPFQEKRLDRLLLKLRKLADDFVAHQALQESPEVSYSFLLPWLEQKNLSKHFEQQSKDFKEWLDNNHPKAFRSEFAHFILEQATSNYLHRHHHYAQGDVNLQNTMNALDQYYLVEKLSFATAMYNRQAVMPVSYTPFFIDAIEDTLKKNPGEFSPAVHLHHKALLLAKHPESQEHYFKLKTAFLSQAQSLDKKDALALSLILQNTVGKAIGQQHPDYFKELFDLYELQIQNNWVLLGNGTILGNVFKNIVTVGTTLGKLSWTRNFIDQFGPCLEEEDKQDILGYAQAMLAFEKGSYNETLRLLAPLSRSNVFFDLSMRRLILKVYYEQKEDESLYSTISTYRVFLHRLDRVAPYFKEANIAFLNLLSALSRIRIDSDEDKLESLLEELNTSPLLPERVWLIRKLKELM